MSIAAMLQMPGTKGLFSKAIIQSGSLYRQDNQHVDDISERFLHKLHITPKNIDRLEKVLPALD